MSWNDIPPEMKALNQWVATDESKIPKDPKTGGAASVDNPHTWGTFEQACKCGMPHIGFVFTQEDPFCFIDLDTGKDPSLAKLHAEIVQEADSYTETSISGTGSHIVIKGYLPAGLRADSHHIEIYPHGRYMLMTGWVYLNEPIKYRQELLDYLGDQIKAKRVDADIELISVESNYPDDDIMEKALNAENGLKFKDLFEGNWQNYPEYMGDHSRADLALVTFLDFYTKDVEQVVRIFKQSKLYRPNKGRRGGDGTDYIQRTIKQARARNESDAYVDVDVSTMVEREQQVLQEKQAREEIPFTPNPELPPLVAPEGTLALDNTPELPPGLVGEIAYYIYSAAVRPVPQVALAGALALVSGLVGRQFNIPGSGLNQYIILLAPTGSGKEGAASGIGRLLSKVRETVPSVDQFIGPAEFSSGPAIIKTLDVQPCLFSILGEFGLRLQQMADPRANGAEKTLQKALLNLYSKSGWHQHESSMAYSDREKNTKSIHAPALTILGESTPETFFANLSEEQVLSGLLPRFLFMEYTGKRPPKNETSAFNDPSPELVKKVADLVATCIQFQANNQCQKVFIDAEAQELYNEFDKFCDSKINNGTEIYKQLWNRSHLKALRLGAVIAVGLNWVNPAIDAKVAKWAIDMVRQDSQVISTRFENNIVGHGEHTYESHIRQVTEDYFALSPASKQNYKIPKSIITAKGVIPFTYYRRRLRTIAAFKQDRRGLKSAIDSALKDMCEAGILHQVPPVKALEKFKTTSPIYTVGDSW